MIRLDDIHATKLIAQAAHVNLGAVVHSIAHYDEKDIITGGVLIMNDNGYSCEMHQASFGPNWANRELQWAVFNYVFRVRKLKKLFGRVPESNKQARKFNKHLGFKEENIIDDVFQGGEGLVIVGMYVEDCRYLNMELPTIKFASPVKTNIGLIYEYSQSIGD